MAAETRASCLQSNQLASLYHQNWQVRVKKVECPEELTRVTGCRLVMGGWSSFYSCDQNGRPLTTN